MPILIVCESALLRDMLRSTCQEKNQEVREVSPSVAELTLFQDGDIVLIHAMDDCGEAASAVSSLRASDNHVRIVVLCASRVVECLRKELGDSVEAIIPDTLHTDSLTATLTMLDNGYTVLHADQMGHRTDLNPVSFEDQATPDTTRHEKTDALSKQEIAVLSSLQQGLPNKTIGKHLGISEATVKVHLRSIYQKLRVKNRTQAALQANAIHDRRKD